MEFSQFKKDTSFLKKDVRSTDSPVQETQIAIRRMASASLPSTKQGKEEFFNKMISLSEEYPELKDWVKPVQALVSYYKSDNYAVIQNVLDKGNEEEKRIMSQLEGDAHGF